MPVPQPTQPSRRLADQTIKKNARPQIQNEAFIFSFRVNNQEGRARLPRPASSPYNETVGRIILFDIDMTLLYSGGAGSLSMRRAFHQLYGIEDGFKRVEFSGRTDWSILRQALAHHDLLDGDEAFARELARFQETYYSILEPTLREIEGGRTLPGVPELLAAVSQRTDARRGLATGNFRRAAHMKLRHFGLDSYLSEGGFGDDAEDRARVVGIAIERVANGAQPDVVWVIGDTALDIDAAHANGALALAVATGPLSVEELRASGADAAMQDLSDTEAVLRLLFA
jgi:phosphoglycolate phosphatase